ncbi:YggS family pyridoxal phosphate-dependent enzyme [Fusicatenibacter faecihominis]|uniref:Pyridoxal phosphate homeostasis protein n=1 Tax=Fusicatenibacter faecihominis TaxID=2881276 RepID=A0AAE3J5D6_9FIRM|nr:YggS family pyridoxal phosphate-dependent enzyme [Fusicatenibacter faecihominis]MBR9938714.1 YggS family pyridoxal phosphate-dependent enzyme [Lachnospiraceae bacterium Marseille-Q4251]MCC2188999.1 YggS family pyridoxal phosphate-dependent enzyme [Fusicatenibacter faecihominis]
MLLDNLKDVEERIQAACDRSGRKREDVLLVAVSKTKPVEMIEEVMTAGIVDFGENKPQELRDKYEVLPQNLRFHMIGHLQTNKIKYVIDRVVLIHSIDSIHLAEAVNAEAKKHNRIMPVLVEVNVAQEESKSGFLVEKTENAIREIAKLSNIRVEGLMTIAPFVENAEENRQYFVKLRKLSVDIAAKNIDNVTMHHLSMGMTGDYEVAIEEGATMVRVGTGIFGERNYQIG